VRSVRAGDAIHLVSSGELDLATVPLLQAAFDQALSERTAQIVVDLAAVSFVDSTGLRTLLEMAGRCEEGRLRMRPSGALERLVAVTGVRDRLPLVEGSGAAPG
jgi:anti-sigma B factor antagonist